MLKEELGNKPELLPNGKKNTEGLTWARILAQQAVQHASKGNQSYYKEILDRIEGKVKDEVEVGGEADLLAALTMIGRGEHT